MLSHWSGLNLLKTQTQFDIPIILYTLINANPFIFLIIYLQKMTQWGRQLMDLTYPITSMFSGRDFNQTIRGTFGDVYIEDLWIPYFTLTTDISASCARTHTHGNVSLVALTALISHFASYLLHFPIKYVLRIWFFRDNNGWCCPAESFLKFALFRLFD